MAQGGYKKSLRIAAVDQDKAETKGWIDIPAISPSLEFSGDMLDTTNLTTDGGYKARMMGLHDWSINADSIYSTGDNALKLIRKSKLNRQYIYVQYLLDGKVSDATYKLAGVANDDAKKTAFLEGITDTEERKKLEDHVKGEVLKYANGYQGKVAVENFNLSGDVGGLETVSITLQADGGLTDATVLPVV